MKIRELSGPHLIMALLIVGFFLSIGVVSYLGTAIFGRFNVSSVAFSQEGSIPDRFADTEHGENISPKISWEKGPSNTETYVLVCFDAEGPPGGRYHWIVYNIPAYVTALPEGAGKKGSLEVVGVSDARHAYNSWRRLGYMGPQEDSPGVKRLYKFIVYALRASLQFAEKNVELKDFIRELEAAKKDGRVIGSGELRGKHYFPRPMKMVFG